MLSGPLKKSKDFNLYKTPIIYVKSDKLEEWLTQDNDKCMDCNDEEQKEWIDLCKLVQNTVIAHIQPILQNHLDIQWTKTTPFYQTKECGSDGMVFRRDNTISKAVLSVSKEAHDFLADTWKIAEKMLIGPKILHTQRLPIRKINYSTKTQRYRIQKFYISLICMEYLERQKVDNEKAVIALVERAAETGMLHGDVSISNIRYTSDLKEARFIDWDVCIFFIPHEIHTLIAKYLMLVMLSVNSNIVSYLETAKRIRQEILESGTKTTIIEHVSEFFHEYPENEDAETDFNQTMLLFEKQMGKSSPTFMEEIMEESKNKKTQPLQDSTNRN